MDHHRSCRESPGITRDFLAQRVRISADVQLDVLGRGFVLETHQIGILGRHRLGQRGDFRLDCVESGFLFRAEKAQEVLALELEDPIFLYVGLVIFA